MFEIVERSEMAQGTIVSNWIKAPKIAAKAKPGQFVILRANEKGERIPLTMADTDPAKGLINIIYMVVGKSTALFKTLQVGQSYLDVIGPLGQPTHLENVGKVICVGGGTGIAVLHPIARGLKQAGNFVYSVIGAPPKTCSSAPTTGPTATTASSPTSSRKPSPRIRISSWRCASARCP